MFWLGLVGLVFLLWGWWHSTRYRTVLAWRTATGHAEVHSIGHVVATGEVRGLPPLWGGRWHIEHARGMKMDTDQKTGALVVPRYPVLPRYVEFNRVALDLPGIKGETWRVAVAFWFIVAVYGCAWVCACVLWQRLKKRKRRKRRLMPNDAADAAEVRRS
ncbi:MAG: hypothetical protein EOP87_17390 [Verrucomicrobiaceae bacterium]|nr:MAG: hypothetical protein EOP87_17390 [Verrucomicrobiaceae bacterium]